MTGPVSMAKRNGMRLRKISATLVQAQILKVRGQDGDAVSLLNDAVLEAKTFGYATKTSEAMALLSAYQGHQVN